MLTMDSASDLQLDTEFDEMLVEMKPYVLRLPHKTERQRCAVWIKKFCEPVGPGISARKNRNSYAQILAHMLKKGVLEGPFTDKPRSGPLQTLPSYMSVYLEDSKETLSDHQKNPVPDWVTGELGSELTAGLSSLGSLDLSPVTAHPSHHPLGPSSSHHPLAPPPPHNTFPSALHGPGIPRGIPPPPQRARSRERHRLELDEPQYNRKSHHHRERTPSPPRSRGHDQPMGRHDLQPPEPFDPKDWQNGTTFQTTGGNTLFGDDSALPRNTGNDTTLPRGQSREVELRTKMVEAKFQEDKLRLQQKHDSTVQKILDRKNTELEELKRHYRSKTKEQEDLNAKLDKKLSSLTKELMSTRESREQEVAELRKSVEDVRASRQAELDKRLSEAHGKFEEEKFSMQKQHTKNIQDLLDNTNGRLSKMEAEYSQQMDATTAVVRELEARVLQLGGEAENLNKIRNALERDKMDLEGRVDRLQADVMGRTERDKMDLEGLVDRLQADVMGRTERCSVMERELRRQKEESEGELRNHRNRHEAEIEGLKQEHTLAANKAAETISSLEEHILQFKQILEIAESTNSRQIFAADRIAESDQKASQLKQALENAEQQRQNDIRDVEHSYQQDKLHLESLHEKKIRSLQHELAQVEQDYQKKNHKLEQQIRDKEAEQRRLVDTHQHQSAQSEQALEEFKVQVEKNSTKIYTEMKQQMEKVEQDLHRSKQLREKQAKESHRQLDEIRAQHTAQLMELKMQGEQDRASLLADFHAQKDVWQSDRDQELDRLRDVLAGDLANADAKTREQHARDAQMISELEKQVLGLKEELLKANCLRKQQLTELGLLREEERAKMERQHAKQISALKSEAEHQRLDLERRHSSEMETMIDKTNQKLKDIEKEYASQAAKANETITDLQRSLSELRNKMNRQQEEAEHEVTMTTTRLDEEKRKMKHHHAASVMSLQQEIETQRARCRQLERNLQQQETDGEEKMTEIRAKYEERLRGLVPATVRQELEDTIASLRQQVSLLQQRLLVVQDDLEQRRNYGPLGGATYPPPGGATYPPPGGAAYPPLGGANLAASLGNSTGSVKSVS